jgi:hypothetical protein
MDYFRGYYITTKDVDDIKLYVSDILNMNNTYNIPIRQTFFTKSA